MSHSAAVKHKQRISLSFSLPISNHLPVLTVKFLLPQIIAIIVTRAFSALLAVKESGKKYSYPSIASAKMSSFATAFWSSDLAGGMLLRSSYLTVSNGLQVSVSSSESYSKAFRRTSKSLP